MTGKVYTTPAGHCCFTSMLNSAYFLFFWYNKFENYLNLVCSHQLNKLFFRFSQRVVVVVVIVIIITNKFPTVFFRLRIHVI